MGMTCPFLGHTRLDYVIQIASKSKNSKFNNVESLHSRRNMQIVGCAGTAKFVLCPYL